MYLAVVLDAWSRKCWLVDGESLRTELVLDALEMAIGQRRPGDVIHHSDQGSQYTSLAFGGRCRAIPSMRARSSASITKSSLSLRRNGVVHVYKVGFSVTHAEGR